MRELTANILNFNVTFGEDHEEMIKYFENIVYPAFKKGYKQYYKGEDNPNYYQIMSVELKEINKRLALTGILIKKDNIEDVTEPDEDNNIIQKKNSSFTLFPISYFIIYLDNHRMIYVRNQKESPNYISFKVAVRYALKQYISALNKINKVKKIKYRYPYPLVDITHMPNKNSIQEKLKNVKKVNSLRMNLFIPNSEPIRNAAIQGVIDEAVKIKSNHAKIEMSSTEDINAVADLVVSTSGQCEHVLKITDKNDIKRVIDSEEMSESHIIKINDFDNTDEIIQTISIKTSDFEILKAIDNKAKLLYNSLKENFKKLL